MIVTIAQADDWSGIYIDNWLEREGHSLSAVDAFEVMLCVNRDYVEGLKMVTVNEEWLEYHQCGTLPKRLDGLVLEGETE